MAHGSRQWPNLIQFSHPGSRNSCAFFCFAFKWAPVCSITGHRLERDRSLGICGCVLMIRNRKPWIPCLEIRVVDLWTVSIWIGTKIRQGSFEAKTCMVIQSFRQAFIHGMQCATPVSVTCSDWVRACNFKMVGAICLKLLNCFFQKVDQNYTIDIKHIQQLNASHCFVSTFCTRYDTAYRPKCLNHPRKKPGRCWFWGSLRMVSGKSLLDVNNSMPLTVLPPHFAGVMTRPWSQKCLNHPRHSKKKTTHSPIGYKFVSFFLEKDWPHIGAESASYEGTVHVPTSMGKRLLRLWSFFYANGKFGMNCHCGDLLDIDLHHFVGDPTPTATCQIWVVTDCHKPGGPSSPKASQVQTSGGGFW